MPLSRGKDSEGLSVPLVELPEVGGLRRMYSFWGFATDGRWILYSQFDQGGGDLMAGRELRVRPEAADRPAPMLIVLVFRQARGTPAKKPIFPLNRPNLDV
jgi:hypothetical protein